MVTPAELASWQPERLGEIADDVADRRRTLAGLGTDLDAGRPPASWTLADALVARAEHLRLVDLFTAQVAESTGVVEALDTAVAAIRAAKTLLEGALDRAVAHGLHVDQATGAVTAGHAVDDEDEAADAVIVQNEIEEQIATALRNAATADQDLAAALTRASTTDVNTVGSLADQRAIVAFDDLGPSAQVQYLLDHPEAYDLLDDHVSDAVQARVGQRIGAGLDGLSHDTRGLSDPAKVGRYTALLDAFGDDPDVMGPLYERLGSDGLLGTLYGLGNLLHVDVNADALRSLADELRSGLHTASTDPDFDGEAFGRDLARYATGTADGAQGDAFDRDYGTGPGAASVLDYLLRDGDCGGDLVLGVAEGLDGFERGAPESVRSWIDHNSTTPFNSLDPQVTGPRDVMLTVMGQLTQHPDAGLEFFTDDPGRAEYYFGERDWSRDGFAGIAQAALTIGTDPANIAEHGEDTGMFVAGVMDNLPDNPAFTVEQAGAASEPLADLIKHYMPSVRVALIDPASADSGSLVRTLKLDCFPHLPDQPVFFRDDVRSVLGVALSTEDGLARVAEGVAGFRQTTLENYAARVEAGDPSVSSTTLQNLLNATMKLDGSVQEVVATTAIEGARSEDQRVATFTDLVSTAAKAVPMQGGKIVDVAWAELRQLTSDDVNAAFADNESVARAEQTDDAVDGKVKAVISSYLAMVEAGVVDLPPDLREDWMPDGELITVGDIEPALLGNFESDALGAIANQIVGSDLSASYMDPFHPLKTEDQE